MVERNHGRTRARTAALTEAVYGLRHHIEHLPILHRLAGGDEAKRGVAMAQGFLASLMIMVGSWGVGWLAQSQDSLFARTTVLNPLRVETAGVIVCTILLALGSMIMCRAWLRFGQRGGPNSRASVVTVRNTVLLWTAPLLFAFPIFSRDVYSYLGQGRLMHAGLSPYANWISQLPGWFAQGSDSLWAESASPYGPLFLLAAQGVYFITGGIPELAVLLFRVLAIGGVLLCLYAVPRLAERLGSDPTWAVWISLANPLFLLTMVGGVHNDALMMGGVLLGFLWVYQGRRFAGVLAVSAAIAIKPIVVLALPFIGLAMVPATARIGSRIRAWAYTALVSGVTLTFLGWVSGLWFGWIKAMASAGSAAFPYAPVGLLGLGIGWLVEQAGGNLSSTANGVYTGFKVVALALAIWLAFRRPATSPVLYSALALLASVLLAPIIQPWYLLWLVPFFAVTRVYSGRWTRFWYLLSMVLVLVGVVDQLSVAQWISLLWVRVLAAAIGLLYLGYLVFSDPKTSFIFTRGAGPESTENRNEATTS